MPEVVKAVFNSKVLASCQFERRPAKGRDIGTAVACRFRLPSRWCSEKVTDCVVERDRSLHGSLSAEGEFGVSIAQIQALLPSEALEWDNATIL
jgi:hypothetical protein